MSQIQQIKESVNLIDIIGQYVELKRSGSSFKGLCPFHSESSPSFFVSEQLQRYKCFGCQETGDVFTFLEKYEGVSFYEALQDLADKAGITLEKTTRSSEDELRIEILDVLHLTSAYYHYLLTEHRAGKKALEYLQERGTTAESIKVFQLGYALGGWEGLLSYLHKRKKFSLHVLEKAGLIIKGKNGHYYDRFRDRIMFPLKNHRGQIVGFSGRLLNSNAKAEDGKKETASQEAKYINSPETLVYHKSQMLYGYSELLQFIRKENSIVLVEGEFDVISSAQAHVNNVSAIKGSSLTLDHVKVLQRTVDTIILALDTDQAGVKATKRAIDTVKQVVNNNLQLDLRVVVLPEGKDPDDLVKNNPKAWREAVKESVSAYEFLIQVALRENNQQTAEGKRKIIIDLAPQISGIPHAVEKDFYIKRLAELLDVSPKIIETDLDRFTKGRLTQDKPTSTPPPEVKNQSKIEKLEEYLFFLMLRDDQELIPTRAKAFLENDPQQPYIKKILAKIKSMETFTLQALQLSLPEDLQQVLFDLYANEQYVNLDEKINLTAEWNEKFKELNQLCRQEKSREIEDKLRLLDDQNNQDSETDKEKEELLRELVSLRKASA